MMHYSIAIILVFIVALVVGAASYDWGKHNGIKFHRNLCVSQEVATWGSDDDGAPKFLFKRNFTKKED